MVSDFIAPPCLSNLFHILPSAIFIFSPPRKLAPDSQSIESINIYVFIVTKINIMVSDFIAPSGHPKSVSIPFSRHSLLCLKINSL